MYEGAHARGPAASGNDARVIACVSACICGAAYRLDQFIIIFIPFGTGRKIKLPDRDICPAQILQPIGVVAVGVGDKELFDAADALAFEKGFQRVFADLFGRGAAAVYEDVLSGVDVDAVSLTHVDESDAGIRSFNRDEYKTKKNKK